MTPLLWPASWDEAGLALVKATPVDTVVLPPEAAAMREKLARAGLRTLPLDATREGVWPKVATREGSDSFEAGPTGLPWVDSNGWAIELAHARKPADPVLLRYRPEDKQVLRPAAFALAVADCEAYGGRWVIDPGDRVCRGLMAGNADSRLVWESIAAALRFYRERPPVATPYANAAALSRFQGTAQDLDHEFLNLIAREGVPVHVLPLDGKPAVPHGVRLAVYLDEAPLPSTWAEALSAFVSNGGTLLAARSADPGWGAAAPSAPGVEFRIRGFGKGRVAIADEGFDDPWRLAADAHILMGRRHDLVRLINGASCNMAPRRASGRVSIHIVNYAARPGLNPMAVSVAQPFRAARFRTPERPQMVELRSTKEYDRAVLPLPEFAACAEIELEVS